MPDTLRRLAQCVRLHRGSADLHVVAGGTPPLEESFEEVPAGMQSAEVIEDAGTLSAHTVPQNGPASGFTHFLDGKQTSHLVLYCGPVPVVYACMGAVIRQRGPKGYMLTYLRHPAHGPDEGLYADADRLPEEFRRDLLSAGISLRPAHLPDTEALTLPGLLREARNAIGSHRNQLERRLAERWMERTRGDRSQILMVDGSLRDVFQGDVDQRVVGVVKTCSTPYFPVEEQMACYRLKVGERSSVFRTPRGQRTSVYSWYLRLFSHDNADLTFGLVRLEAAPTVEQPGQFADQVSAWMLAERAPLSKPDPRWDRMTYTIYDCEQYLRSLMPTRQVIAGRLAALRG